MDGFIEKKWFIYMSDHHEGPFSLADIQQKMILGEATPGSFVWAEGMGDWAPMTDVPVFESLLRPEKTKLQGSVIMAPYEPVMAQPIPAPQPAYVAPVLEAHSPAVTSAVTEALPQIPGVTTAAPPPKRRSSSSLIFTLLFIILVLATFSAYTLGYFNSVVNSSALDPILMKLTDTIPALGKWISPIPKLSDVSLDDYETLKAAAQSRIENGPRAAFALSKEDVFFPTFYVASNLPDGTRFQIVADGVPDTLLNQVSFNAKVEATLTKKLGRSSALKFSEGKPIPRGEYKISLFQGDSAGGSKPLAVKTYFLGGQRDTVYTTRLKEFHERLMEKAKAELSELTQFALILETQLGQTGTKFRTYAAGKKINPAQRKSWAAYDQKWNDLSRQMSEHFSKWTPDALANDYFYSPLYLLVQQADQAVDKVHAIHNAFFTSKTPPVDRNAFEVQVGEAVSFAQNAINTLKSKISEAEKIPPTPNGMPRRDGL